MDFTEETHMNGARTTKQGTRVVCPVCDFVLSDGYRTRCPVDGTPLVPKVQFIRTDRRDFAPFGERFSDVLPLNSGDACRESESLRSPLIHAGAFGREYGMNALVLKNECVLPTGTTKARMAAGALSFLFERGVSHFVVTSTGNSSTAMARLMREYPEMKMTAFAGKDFVGRHEFVDIPNIEFRVVDGDFVSAGAAAKEFAAQHDLVWESGFFNPARRIALATSYLEVCEEIGDAPHWYFQAVSSGMGAVGVGEMAASQLELQATSRLPRIVAVQQESCAPMVNAFREHCEVIEDRHCVRNPKGIAKAILRGDPTASYPLVRKHITASNGDLVSVSELDILWAQRLISESFNLQVGESAAAAMAAALKMGKAGAFSQEDIVLVNLTGST